jgi:mannose-6-phosphate isomerase-like protein (cupin superfamily)
MLLMRIDRWDVRRDGPMTELALRHKIKDLGYEAKPRTYPSGTVAATQCETEDCAVAVISGLIKIMIDGESAILAPGDIVFVPRGAVRRVEVVGSATACCLEARHTS